MTTVRMTIDNDLVEKLFDDMDPEVKIEFQNKILYAMMTKSLKTVSEGRFVQLANTAYRDVEKEYMKDAHSYARDKELTDGFKKIIREDANNYYNTELKKMFNPIDVRQEFVDECRQKADRACTDAVAKAERVIEESDRDWIRSCIRQELLSIVQGDE